MKQGLSVILMLTLTFSGCTKPTEPQALTEEPEQSMYEVSVAALPPLTITAEEWEQGCLNPEHLPAAQARLEWISATHPNLDYIEIVAEHSPRLLVLPWSESTGEAGGFRVRNDEERTTRISITWTVLDINSNAGLVWAWLILYHESVHLRQYLATPEEDREYWLEGAESLGTSPDFCERTLRVETEAYRKTCELAIEWGWAYLGGEMCAHVDEPALFEEYARTLVSKSYPSCP